MIFKMGEDRNILSHFFCFMRKELGQRYGVNEEIIDNAIIDTFTNWTKEKKQEQFIIWSRQCYQWLNQARAYIAGQESVLKRLAQQKQKDKLDEEKANSIAIMQTFQIYLRKNNTKDKMTGQNILLSGYKLLNTIGEIIRNDEITYSVTTSTDDTKLSEIKSNNIKVYTWKIPYKTFIKILTFTDTGEINLRRSNVVNSILQDELKKRSSKGKISYEEWDEKKIERYQIFCRQARSNRFWPQYHKINEGNILEAFLRFTEQASLVPHYPVNHHKQQYWGIMYACLQATMKNPDIFFKGGDILDEQIKSINASVTNMKTLINSITKLLNIFSQNVEVRPIIASYYKKNINNQPATDLMEQTEKALMDFFVSSIERDTGLKT